MPGNNIQIFEESAQEYDAWFERQRPVYASELLALKRFIAPAGLGLEIGVGTGRFAVPLGLQVGVEPAAAMAAWPANVASRSFGLLPKPCLFGTLRFIWP